ncbi:FAD/NAD(P)-binding protein [Streptomyces yokosukanensis]|uniref:FAD/NAD(P)-binding protein n=1 Tax=Streptomyces yokosukanensis TaxID=67386 RepID=UPI003444F13D
MHRDIVIIGGGATAVAAFTQVVRTPGIASVTTVDPNPVGLGHAFGVSDPLLLCNTSVDVTSLRPDGPSDLLDYLSARGWAARPEDFVPRYLVGHYCRERYLSGRREAERHGTAVAHHRARATTVRATADGYRVELDDGRRLAATDVLVCLGLDRPRLPELLRPYDGHPRLLPQPYPTGRLRALPDKAEVLVLGSKLSAVDAALVLCADGRRTVMTSPSGRLPAVRTRLCRPDRPLLDSRRWQRLDPRAEDLDRELTRLLLRAIGRAGAGLGLRAQTSSAAVPEERLRQELALAAAGRVPWQDVIAEVIDAINDWTAPWDPALRAEVLGRYRGLMSRYISSIPARNARLISGHLDSGRLSLAPGYPVGIEPVADDDGWEVEWPDGRHERFTHVVCGTGFHTPQLDAAAPGVYRIGPSVVHDAAPEITEDLRLVDPHRGSTERIWVLGAAAHSRTAIVNYLNTAAKQAQRVAAQFTAPAVPAVPAAPSALAA